MLSRFAKGDSKGMFDVWFNAQDWHRFIDKCGLLLHPKHHKVTLFSEYIDNPWKNNTTLHIGYDWLKDEFDLTRNNYDKVGHFVQGFVPAMIAREIVVRHQVFNYVGWRNFFIVCFCLGFSAFYELIEWVVALTSDEAADAFLGTQGYVWDTQSDMAYAMTGAIIALVILGGLHDRQMRANGFIGPLNE